VGLSSPIVSAVAAAAGTSVEVVGPTARGESGSTYNVLVARERAVLKVLAGEPGVLDNQHRLIRLVDVLRSRGYPAPEYLAVGVADDAVFTVQRWIPGDTLEPGPGLPVDPSVLASSLPSILKAVELQTDAGDLADPPWPRWLLDTIQHGGDGYCLHDTMRHRPDTAAVLDRIVRIEGETDRGPVRTGDIVHFDLNPANVLHDNGCVTGVIDWNVPFSGAAQGDRGFDIATLLFYVYDNDTARQELWERSIAISGKGWTAVYLAHLALRQVEWTVRHRPGSAEEHRFLDIARRVLDDCETVS
jgi:aminoglycoside phosphotransferase (APT) family kinase protein